MRKSFAVLVFMLATLVTLPAQAQQKGWQFDLSVSGVSIDNYPGHWMDKLNYKYENTANSKLVRIDYKLTYDPIVVKPQDTAVPMLNLSYGWKKGVVGLRFFSYEGDDSTQGRVESKPCLFYPDKNLLSCDVNTVRAFGHNFLFPLTKMDEESGLSPVNYYAQTSLKLRDIDLYWLLENDRFDWGILIKAVDISESIADGIAMDSFIPHYPDGKESDPDWYNHATLDMTGKMSGTFIGPGFIVRGSVTRNRFIFEASASAALVVGTARYKSEWRDLDNAKLVNHATGTLIRPVVYDGQFPYSDSRTVAIPIVDLTADTFWKVSGWLSLGAGVYAKAYFNVPLSRVWTIPGTWTISEGALWEARSTTLTAMGAHATIRLSF